MYILFAIALIYELITSKNLAILVILSSILAFYECFKGSFKKEE